MANEFPGSQILESAFMISLGTAARILREKLEVPTQDVALALGISTERLIAVEEDRVELSEELAELYLNLWDIDLHALAWCESPDYNRLPKSVQKISEELGEIWQGEIDEVLQRHKAAKTVHGS